MSRARDIADLSSASARLDTVGGSSGALSNRNIIINGAMQVAQRGDTASVQSGYGGCDRFRMASSGAEKVATKPSQISAFSIFPRNKQYTSEKASGSSAAASHRSAPPSRIKTGT